MNVWDELLRQRARAGILLVSGDLTEVLSLSDRIAVIFRGELMGILSAGGRGGDRRDWADAGGGPAGMTRLVLERRAEASAGGRYAGYAVAVGLAGCMGGIVFLLAGANPLTAYTVMARGAFGSLHDLSEVVVKAIPLMLCGLAVAVAAKIQIWNVEGRASSSWAEWAPRAWHCSWHHACLRPSCFPSW